MTFMQSDPVVFDYGKTEHSPAHCKLFPKEEPLQILFFDWAFYLRGSLGVFGALEVFRLRALPAVSAANGSLTVLSGLVKLVIYVRVSFKGYICHS